MTPATIRVLKTWQEMQRPYRACELCAHGSVTLFPLGEQQCHNIKVRGQQRPPVPVAQARAHGGGCGPDAWQMVPR